LEAIATKIQEVMVMVEGFRLFVLGYNNKGGDCNFRA
jgi:hypothetical protein